MQDIFELMAVVTSVGSRVDASGETAFDGSDDLQYLIQAISNDHQCHVSERLRPTA